jgi:hypothetical protein
VTVGKRYVKDKNGKFLGSLPAQPSFNSPLPNHKGASALFDYARGEGDGVSSLEEAKRRYLERLALLYDPNRKAQYMQKENSVLGLFKEGEIVEYAGRSYSIKTADKPFAQDNRGEPKTDVYILLEDRMSGEEKEIKISYKSENYQFLENKMSGNRFREIFNKEETKAIMELLPLNDRVNREFEISTSDLLNEETRLTLGYRLDIMASDATGYMPITVSEETMAEILGGAKLEESKRNGVIHGEQVENSGVANYILVGDGFENANDALSKIIPISEYVKDESKRVIALAPKAVNMIPHRAKHFGGDKTKPWDGNRPLAIALSWTREGDKLVGRPYIKPGSLFRKWAHGVGDALLEKVVDAVDESN